MVKVKLPKEVIPLLIIVFALTIAILIPYTLSLGTSSIAEEGVIASLNLFQALSFVGIIIVLLIFYTKKMWSGDDKYGDGFGFYNIGKDGAWNGLKRFSALQLTWLSLLIFGTIFLFSNVTKSLTGLQFLNTQSFSPIQSLAFSSLLIPMSEELFSLAFTGILVFLLVLISKKYNFSRISYLSAYFLLIPLIIGGIAVIWHITHYSSSDIALLSVFFFWFVKELFILGTGLFLVGWALHFTNNFFIDFTRLYSSDALFTTMIIVLIALAGLYIWVYRKDGAWYKGSG